MEVWRYKYNKKDGSVLITKGKLIKDARPWNSYGTGTGIFYYKDKNGKDVRCNISSNEGEIYINYFWLSEKDGEKARNIISCHWNVSPAFVKIEVPVFSSELYHGISENKLHHILGVARKAYSIAKDLGYSEDFARKMFMEGWCHDVGYEFSEGKGHGAVSSEMVNQLVCWKDTYDVGVSPKTTHAIYYHGKYPDESLERNAEWVILNIADMTVDYDGSEVSMESRLKSIKERYGENSEQFTEASKVYEVIKKSDIAKELCGEI